MEKLLPNVVATTAFCFSSAGTKSRVHFFPIAPNAHASQPVMCKLTLFGKGIERKAVMLDGGRLGQPDGVRLEDAFPVLRAEVAGIFGVEVELSVSNERVNLLSSQVSIEVSSAQFELQYFAAPFVATVIDVPESYAFGNELVVGPRRRTPTLIGLQDSSVTSSLVVVNGSSEALRPHALRSKRGEVVQLPVGTVASDSAVEVALDEALFREVPEAEVSWGRLKAGSVHFAENSDKGVGYFLMHRDAQTKKPLSVCAL
jgi:hypothetical protein